MNITKLAALAAAAVLCTAGCGSRSESGGSQISTAVTTAAPPIGGSENSGEKYDSAKYLDMIKERADKAELDSEPLVLGSVGKLVSPAAGSLAADLGDYRVSSGGVKLYYDEKLFPTELMLTLEKYFTALSEADYNTYRKCIFPSYLDEMDKYLAKDYGYDMKTSFAKQCSNLADMTEGDFTVTRIKLEEAPDYYKDADNIDKYFGRLDELFGSGYYQSVKDDSDRIIDACFFLMGKTAEGGERIIVGEYEIVFAEKDGRYYTFG